jgi:membrane dipeptidase
VAGIDHVGIGSDFDGVSGYLPQGMEDVSKLPNITAELLKRGFSEADVKKVLGENILRVMGEVEKRGGHS